MACSCIKNHYSIHISSEDCKKLIYQDESDWMAGEGFNIPETYPVTISIPSRSKEVTIDVKTKGRTVITSVDLFGSSDLMCLPDDIYCFSTESCGSTIETKV